MTENHKIDNGKAFDWGKTSADYAKYRDIYPKEFYDKILQRGLCDKGMDVLDLGTGTGVLPRALYQYGARFTGTDLSENQVLEARRLAQEQQMDIRFLASPAEALPFADNSFDTVTACQCFFYFDRNRVYPEISRVLKPGGRLCILYMAWLPEEDKIAGASEALVLQYNPDWSGKGERRHPLAFEPEAAPYFEQEHSEVFDLQVPFTRESWNGRMKACRGIGASLSEEKVRAFDSEHMALLSKIAPERFTIRHYAAMLVLKSTKAG